jgi:hypothetical protein
VFLLSLGWVGVHQDSTGVMVGGTRTGADWDDASTMDTSFRFLAGYASAAGDPEEVKIEVKKDMTAAEVASALCSAWNTANPETEFRAEICGTDSTLVIFDGATSLVVLDGDSKLHILSSHKTTIHGGLRVSRQACP